MEEKDVEKIEEILSCSYSKFAEYQEPLEKLLKAYKQDLNIIEKMALAIWRNDNVPCTINYKMTTNYKDVINYFRKKCE